MRPEDTKSRALRIKVDYHQTRSLLRRRATLLSWLFPFLVLGWISYTFGYQGSEQVFSSGAVSSRHASFEHNCNQCHTDSFSKIPDTTCLNCHDSPDHHANMEHRLDCVDCHKEHGTVQELASVDDDHCAICHDDLKLKKNGELTASTEFDKQIRVFLAETADRPEGHRDIRFMERYTAAKSLISNPKAADKKWTPAETQQLREGLDTNPLLLNHQKHLTYAKVKFDWSNPRYTLNDDSTVQHGRVRRGDHGFAVEVDAENAPFLKHTEEDPWFFFQSRVSTGYVRKSGLTAIREKKSAQAISCATCHEPVAAGDYFAAPNFEQHCMDCHALPGNAGLLAFVPDIEVGMKSGKKVQLRSLFHSDQKLSRQLNEQGTKTVITVPHEDFLTIRGYLRDAVERYVELSDGKFEATKRIRKRIKRRMRAVTIKMKLSPEQFIDQTVASIETSIYKASCQKCHEDKSHPIAPFEVSKSEVRRTISVNDEKGSPQEISYDWLKDVEIVPPTTPIRWFGHAEFDHASHKSTECLSCHAGAGGDPVLPDPHQLNQQEIQSNMADLLADARTGLKPEAEIRLKSTLVSLKFLNPEAQKDPLDSDLVSASVAKLESMAKDSEKLFAHIIERKFATASSKTHDVLLPNLATCMSCHNPQGGARAGCVECHIFHDRAKQTNKSGFKTINEMRNIMAVGGTAPSGFKRIVEYVKTLNTDGQQTSKTPAQNKPADAPKSGDGKPSDNSSKQPPAKEDPKAPVKKADEEQPKDKD